MPAPISPGGTPLIVQSDATVLVDVHAPGYEEARALLAAFAELEKSPEHMHTYRLSPLSLWNAASAGLSAREILDTLGTYGRFAVPDNVRFFVNDTIDRFGKLLLRETTDAKQLFLSIADPTIRQELSLIHI